MGIGKLLEERLKESGMGGKNFGEIHYHYNVTKARGLPPFPS